MAALIIANLCIYILTWNVGSHQPRDLSLMGALSLDGTTTCPNQQLPDIYVVGLQEVSTRVPSQIQNIFHDNPWTCAISNHLARHGYKKISTEQLQGMLVMMFAQSQHVLHIKDVEATSTGTGLVNHWGNKGAVSIRMSLYGMGVTFLCAHLAANANKLKDRIEDYSQIIRSHHYKTKDYKRIMDHDYVFWFGDLNFRLTDSNAASDVCSLVEQGKFSELWQRDQLQSVRTTGQAFELFNDQQPTFPPTFKFFEGTSVYDLNRNPAWCDRILYRVRKSCQAGIILKLEQLSYKSHPDYVLSDHKPVTAEFLYTIEAQTQKDKEKYESKHGAAEKSVPKNFVIKCF